MRAKIAPVKNISRFATLAQSLLDRTVSHPGIGVAFGRTGFGKSTTLAWWANKFDAVYVRAFELWTPSAMLSTICDELGVRRYAANAETMKLIAETLSRSGRPLIIDEADYVIDQRKLLNTLRDLHDISGSPLVMVGMADFLKKLISRRDQQQFVGRVSQWVEFLPADLDDVTVLARDLCEVEVAPDLLARLHGDAKGSVRLTVVGLDQIEKFARARNLKRVTAADAKGLALNLQQTQGMADRLRIAALAASEAF